jgi:hypothetical protein
VQDPVKSILGKCLHLGLPSTSKVLDLNTQAIKLVKVHQPCINLVLNLPNAGACPQDFFFLLWLGILFFGSMEPCICSMFFFANLPNVACSFLFSRTHK